MLTTLPVKELTPTTDYFFFYSLLPGVKRVPLADLDSSDILDAEDTASIPGVVSTAASRSRFEEEDDFAYPTEHTEWIPHYVMTEWENNAGIRCISMLVNLSSGSANSSSRGIDVDLDNDGNTLTIGERWSDMTQDMDVF